MAKNINHLQHVKSNVVEEGLPKLPQPSVLVEGEIAVNYAADYETLSIKNSSGEVVTFSSDNYYSEKKLGSGFTGENSGVTVTQAMNNTEKVVAAALNDLNSRKLDVSAYTESVGDFYTKEEIDGVLGSGFTVSSVTSSITDAFKENELVIAAALNDLDDRKLDASAYTPTDLSDYATKQWVDEERLGSGFTGENSGRTVTQVIEDDELAISAALNDLNTRKLDASGYTSGKLDIWQVTDFDFASAGYSCDDLTPYIQGEKYLVIFNTRDESDYAGGYYMFGVDDVPYGIFNIGDISFTALFDCDGDDIIVDEYLVNEYYTAVSSVTMNGSTIESVNKNINLGTVVSSVTVNGSAVTVSNGVAPLNITATYDSNTKKIYLKNGNATMSEIDATDFIKDGMVNDVVVDEPVSGSNSGVTCLIVTFNTDAGKEDIEIPLSEMFDSELYYTKEEVNTMLGDDFIDFSGESFSSVTDIIRADETVMAAALNDLNDRKLDASAYTPSEFTDLLDEKLGYWFSGDSLSSVTDVIRENEIVVSSALNDLDSRKLDASAYTPTDLSDYATEEWVDERLGSGFTESSVTEVFNETEEVIAEALADLDSRISGNTTYINQVNSKADTIARSLSGYTPSGYSYSKSEVDVKLADKLDASAYTPTDLSGYYTKQEIDEDKLGSGFTGENSGKTVTQAINETEIVVAAALNDLDERKLDASAYTPTDLSDYATKEWIENNVLGSGFTGEYSGKSITEVIEENELIISSALNDLDERIDEISGSSSGGGSGAVIWDNIGTYPNSLDFSNHTFSELESIMQDGGDLILMDNSGNIYRLTINDSLGYYTFIGDMVMNRDVDDWVSSQPCIVLSEGTNDAIQVSTMTPVSLDAIVSGFYEDGTLYITNKRGIDIEISGFTTGGGGDANTLSGVSVNGTPASVSNKVANITSVPASIVATSSTLNFVSSNEKSTWNGKQNALSNASVLSGITSQQVTNWDNASASAHSHSNKSVLDGITSTKVSNWDSAFTQAHTHDNKTILDNLTQAVIDNNHTHSNKTVLDGITTAKTAQWDNAISAVSFNGTDATVTNHKAAITATIPTSLSQLTSAHTHTISEVTNLQSTLNAKVSGITVNNGSKVTPTNGVANLTINASTVGALASGTTLDGIADGTTRKLSDYATTGTVNTHTGNTAIHLPAVTAADNGKILMVVNGQWALVNPTTIYTGTGTPSSSQGNDGDIYLQTS